MKKITEHLGADVAIDAVGAEADGNFLQHLAGAKLKLQGGSPVALNWAIDSVRKRRTAHWLILVVADRVDAFGSHLRSFLSLRPDNPITGDGCNQRGHSSRISSRVGKKRSDLVHQPLDLVIVGAPWVVGGGAAYVGAKRLLKGRARPRQAHEQP